jgi:recombination protein RecA
VRTKKPSTSKVASQVASRDRSAGGVSQDPPLVSTGSTLLNLALSDTTDGGFSLGRIVNVIGDSSSGKTMLALTTLAESARLIKPKYNDVEAACSFDLGRLFGMSLAEALETEDPHSDTIEDFQEDIHKWIKEEAPFIYVLDSLDALTSEEDAKKLGEKLEARAKGQKAKGTYSMAKPKLMSEILRQINKGLDDAGSLLIVVSQTRDNINPMSFVKKYRSGGKALEFYCSHVLWMAIEGKIKKKGQIIGVNTKVKVTKNKLTGKVREVEFPIYYDLGIDDVGSCVDWLIKNGFWKKKGQKISTKKFGELTREKLIKTIEDKNLEPRLRKLVGHSWLKVEESLKLNRKRRYK